MTLKIKIILIFLNIFFVSTNIKSKCNCLEKEINHVENIIYYNNLEINYFNERLYDFELFIVRENVLLNKWECIYNDFQNYINSTTCENKLISANYRFLKWLHITAKKLIGYKRKLETELKQISYEFEAINFSNNINYLNNLQSNLLNQINIKCKDILIYDITDLIDRKNQIINLFNRVAKDGNNLIEKSIQFKSKIKELICSGRFEQCCCWY